MAKKFLVNLSLEGNKLQKTYAEGFVVENSSGSAGVSIQSIQSTSGKGQLYYDTSASGLYYYNGSTWLKVANTGDVATASATNITGTSSAGNFYPIFSTGSGTGMTLYADGGNNLTYNPSTDTLTSPSISATNIGVSGTVTSGSFSGNGAALSNITGANVTGTVASATNSSNIAIINTASNATFYPTFVTGSGTVAVYSASAGLTFNPSSNILSATQFSGGGSALTSITGSAVTGSVTSASNATNVTVANDTTTSSAQYIAFVGASGNTGIKTTSASLTYTPTSGILAAPFFSGNGSALTSITGSAVTGSVTSASNATNSTIIDTTSSGTFYPTFVSSSTGNLPIRTTSASLSYVPTTGIFSAPVFSGSFSGNGSALTSLTGSAVTGSVNSALTAASANNLAVVAGSQNATTYIPFVSATSGTLAASATASLSFNPSTGRLSTSNLSVSGAGASSTYLLDTFATSGTSDQSATYALRIETIGRNNGATGTVTGRSILLQTAADDTGLGGVGQGGGITISAGTGFAPAASAGVLILRSSSLGFMDNVAIGTTTPASARFTTASTSGNITTAASFIGVGASVSGSVIAASFGGNGAALTSITASNVSGSVTSATNSTNVTIANDTTSSVAQYVTFASASTGNTGIKTTAASLTYIPTTGVFAAPIFSGNGSALTTLTAANLTGTITASVLGNSSLFVGTTSIALNRSSATQALTGISSITGLTNLVFPGSTSGSVTIVQPATPGTSSVTLPNASGTLALTSDITNATITVNASAGALVNGTSTDSFTLNQSAAKTLAITTNGTSANTVSTLVQRDGSGNFSAGTITATLTGVASSATNLNVTASATQNATTYIPFFSSSVTGQQSASVNTSLTYNASTGLLTATTFSGAHSGNGSALTSLTASQLTGIVAIANGGTNASATPNTNGVFYYDGTKYVSTASGAANSILISSAGTPAFAASGTVSVGTAASATNLAVTSASQNATTFIPFFSTNSGTTTQAASVTSGLTFNPSTGNLTATTFTGALSGNATTATTATNIAGGAANRIPYNTAAGTTSFVAAPSAASSVLAYTTTNTFGYVSYDSASTANTLVVRDSNGRFQAADPSANQDVATKNYVDTVAQGLNAHAAVVAATASADVLSASYVDGTSDASGGLGIGAYLEGSANGVFPTVDGNVTLAVNDRFLVKSYTGSSAVWNGVYTLTASGAAGSKWRLTRSVDTNNSTAGEFAYGDYFFVVSGSTQAGTGWVVTTKGTGTPANTIKIGTDQVTLSQFSGQGTITAGDGISISGNTISFRPSATGGLQNSSASASIKLATNSGLSTDANGLTVGVGTGLATSTGSVIFNSGTTAQSGTGVSTPASWTYATQKQAFTITGNGVFTSTTLTHNLNSTDILVQVYESSTGNEVELDITRTSASVVTLTWAQAPGNGTVYKAVLMG